MATANDWVTAGVIPYTWDGKLCVFLLAPTQTGKFPYFSDFSGERQGSEGPEVTAARNFLYEFTGRQLKAQPDAIEKLVERIAETKGKSTYFIPNAANKHLTILVEMTHGLKPGKQCLWVPADEILRHSTAEGFFVSFVRPGTDDENEELLSCVSQIKERFQRREFDTWNPPTPLPVDLTKDSKKSASPPPPPQPKETQAAAKPHVPVQVVSEPVNVIASQEVTAPSKPPSAPQRQKSTAAAPREASPTTKVTPRSSTPVPAKRTEASAYAPATQSTQALPGHPTAQPHGQYNAGEMNYGSAALTPFTGVLPQGPPLGLPSSQHSFGNWNNFPNWASFSSYGGPTTLAANEYSRSYGFHDQYNGFRNSMSMFNPAYTASSPFGGPSPFDYQTQQSPAPSTAPTFSYNPSQSFAPVGQTFNYPQLQQAPTQQATVASTQQSPFASQAFGQPYSFSGAFGSQFGSQYGAQFGSQLGSPAFGQDSTFTSPLGSQYFGQSFAQTPSFTQPTASFGQQNVSLGFGASPFGQASSSYPYSGFQSSTLGATASVSSPFHNFGYY